MLPNYYSIMYISTILCVHKEREACLYMNLSILTLILSTLVCVLTLYSCMDVYSVYCKYHGVPGKRPLPGKRPCTAFHGATVAASIQTYGILIPGKHPCGPKSQSMFKRPWVLTRDTTVHAHIKLSYEFLLCPFTFKLISCGLEAEECWNLVQSFAHCHRQPPSLEFVKLCAKHGEWLPLLCHAEIFRIPPNKVRPDFFYLLYIVYLTRWLKIIRYTA